MSFARASIGALALAASLTGVSASLKTCSNNNTLSCHSSSKAGTCCYNYPGGALLQTQFWDTDPVTGPTDSWTIHGLWYVSLTSEHTFPAPGSSMLYIPCHYQCQWHCQDDVLINC